MKSKKPDKTFIYKTLVVSTLLQYFPFKKDEIDELLKKALLRTFKKNQTVLAIGEVEQYISIIHRGVARKYLVDHNNREITTEISSQCEVICSNSSLGYGAPSSYAIQAIENLILISITLYYLRELFIISPSNIEFEKRIVAAYLYKIEEREILLAKYEAKKR